MNELFNVTTNGDKLTLSARELYKELNIAGRFSRWFEQMSEYGFEENVDFTSVQNCTVVNNGATRELQDYRITRTTKVTGQGQIFFINKFKKELA